MRDRVRSGLAVKASPRHAAHIGCHMRAERACSAPRAGRKGVRHTWRAAACAPEGKARTGLWSDTLTSLRVYSTADTRCSSPSRVCSVHSTRSVHAGVRFLSDESYASESAQRIASGGRVGAACGSAQRQAPVRRGGAVVQPLRARRARAH